MGLYEEVLSVGWKGMWEGKRERECRVLPMFEKKR